jgi:hypothetical protein
VRSPASAIDPSITHLLGDELRQRAARHIHEATFPGGATTPSRTTRLALSPLPAMRCMPRVSAMHSWKARVRLRSAAFPGNFEVRD